ncbi:dynein axonemal heavy chain 10-like [Neocloeon triangulifer]|uniref:dynein axonemal heavy chain 10-like n=1 Tax=Neocloeon triangulifer TaxID=2078957 RepID=UPI00286F290D|nr:dynein axonemal heavy chain 10-like [Neocloeon triangulifer]
MPSGNSSTSGSPPPTPLPFRTPSNAPSAPSTPIKCNLPLYSTHGGDWFVEPFLDKVRAWEEKLSIVEECVTLWSMISNLWTEVWSLFGVREADVPPEAAEAFGATRKVYLALVGEAGKSPQVLATCAAPGYAKRLRSLLAALEADAASFRRLLAAHRQNLPRLHFVPDRQLVALLAAPLPLCFQRILGKKSNAYPHISRVEMEGDSAEGWTLTGFTSIEGELVPFERPFKVDPEAGRAFLLSRLDEAIKAAVAASVARSVAAPAGDVVGVVEGAAATLWQPALDVAWTEQVEGSLRKGVAPSCAPFDAALAAVVDALRGQRPRVQAAKLAAAVVLLAHHRSVVERLVAAAAAHPDHFLWHTQLRFYSSPPQPLQVRQAFAQLDYGYEFSGIGGQIVRTLASERATLASTQALSLKCDVLLRGWGKASVVRDLAKSVGRRLVETHCGGGGSQVGRLLVGVAQTGFWGCLGRLEALDPSALSLLAARLRTLRAARLLALPSFALDAATPELRLHPAGAIFATAASKPHRKQLPLTLTALFRPAACAQPDLLAVCAVNLQAITFKNYKKLSRKMTKILELSRDRLSSQTHYEFGVSFANVTFDFLRASLTNRKVEEAEEEELLAMALRKSVLHRLHSDDRATFDQLMADIFVRINSSPEDQIVIREKISALMNRNNLKVIEGQSRQVCHVVEALQLRGWVAVLGASGGGKSVVLQAALQVLEAEICPLNPKACTLDEFFGLEGPDRVEGLLSSCLRRASGSAKKKALLFDAQIEPGWFDALSAALLDFPDQDDVLFVFESDAMPRATPTLLHRAPVVFIDPATVHFKEIWEAKRFDSSAELQGLFERFAVPLLEQLDKWRTLVPFSATAAVEQLSDVLAALMKSSGPSDLAPTFLQAVRLSLGALLPTDLRPEFDLKVRKAAADDLLLPPDEGSLFDFCWCPQKQTWIRWQDEAVPSERFVPTPTTAFFHWILDRFNQSCFHDLVFKKVSRPLVLIGCEGSSKSLTVQTFLSNLDPSTQAWQSLNFSLQTSAADVLSALKGWLRLRTRNVAQPADNKKLLLFLDDLHMPLHDELGSQEPIEFLRALLQNGGFYNDRDSNFQWVRLENVGFIGSITCDELNPTRVSPRFLARLNLVLAPKISDEQLHHIFSTLLSNHLRDFSPQVQQLADTIISASLHLYSVLSESLGATPERWMCRPGVLDLTRLVVGMCQARPGNFGEPETLVRVWRHEVDRVFVDRLESLADRREAERLVQDAVHHFFAPFERHALRNPLLFGDFRNALVAQRQHPRCYEDLLDFEAVFFLFQEVLEEYNKGSEEKLEVVLLDSGLEHVSRLHRVLRMRRGHSVLVGPPGCGRRSLFRLAAHAAQCRPFRLPLCPRAATHTLRKVFDQVGSGTLDAAVVLVRDHHLRNKGVAEMVYQVISSGWVPSLFREGVQAEEFKAACVAGVHVVLSLERSTLLALTGEYPELLKFATLDWFRPWDQSALLKVSKHFIANSSLVVAEKKESVLAHVARTHEVAEGIFAQQHQSLGAINCSPRLYVDFVRHFLRLLETNLSRTHATLTELLTALAKIGKARDGLVEFREILREKETLLEKEKGASEDLVRKIVAVEEEREGKTEAWSEWERGVERQVRTLASDRLQVRRVLDCALPELAAAQQAIAALQQQDVAQIREYLLDSSPSSECLKQFVVQIPLLRGQESATADQILDNVQVFQKVFLLPDHDTLSHSACRKLKVLLKRCSTLDASILENVSAFKSLVGFVDAALQYCNVVREIKPKLEQIAGTELELTQAREKSGGVQEEVVLLERRISELSEEDSRRRQKVSEAERDATSFADRLTGLENLFASLQNDEERMLVSVNELEAEKRNLLGDCLLTSAFLSYAGPLSGVGPRKDAIEEWRRSLATLNIPFSPRFSPSKLLPHASRKLSFLGLEDADEATQLNCLLVFAAIRAPLCVDTQQQAADWVKTVEGRSLVMASALDGDLVERVRGAVETGTPLLLQDVGKSVDAALFDLLDELSKGGGEGKVRVGDEWVALHPQFRLYLNSREANPQLDAAVFSKTTVVDCTMSAQALEETLLRDVIGVKEPQVLKFHLEEKVRSLESRRRESELYSQLLRLLADVPEEVLLEDQQFLNNLRTTKDSISQCEKRISRTSDSEVFEATKAALLGVARRAAVVFSVLADLAHVSPTYLFSLTTFRHLLASALREGGDPGDAITTNVHRFVCRSLFPEHQLTFTMALVVRIGLCDGHLAADEVAFVFDDLEGAEGVEGAPTWLPPKAVQGAWLLQQRFPALFGPFLDTLQQEPWRKWIEEAVPEQQPLPDDWDQRLTPFQGLMVVRALRSDRLVPALRLFVCRNYGNHFITPVIPSMRSLLDESSARTPIVLVVSGGGVDPSTELHRLARQKGLDAGHFVSLAFTKHSQKEAMEAVLSASRQGQWLLLLNCHLVARLSALIWRHLDLSVPHPDFRLWLTTDDVAHLPPILLHHALKVVLEVPRGLKLKLTATFRKMDPEVMAASKHPHFGKVLYALAQLHATLQERCEFESLGWNGEYHFSKPDFDASAAFLGHFLNRCGSKVPWHSIRTFIQQVVYGAHMTDTWDLGLVGVYLRELCGAHVLGPKFAFYQDERVTYGLPAVHNLFGILAYVENLADDLNPAALGLHANADLRHNARALQTLRSNLAKLQPAPALAVCDGDEGAEREELLRALRLLRDAVPEGVAESGHAPESFIALEIRGFNRLLAAVRDSLDALQNVVSGKGGKMSRQKRETLDALRKERVPDAWQRLAPPTNKTLLPWTRHLKLRHKQYYEWVMIHEPLVAWLPGLASPRAFLQSVLQTACRKHHWPLELAGLAADFLPSTSASRLPALTDGVYVKGVHVENGGWDADGACLRVASPGELTQKLPVLRVTAVATAPQPHPGRVRLPLYFSSGHCDAALWHFDLPCKDHPSTYVLHAAKLLLHTDQLD